MRSRNLSQRISSILPLVTLTASLMLLASVGPREARADAESPAKSSAPTDSVTISDPWARATPSGAHMGAIYLKLMSSKGDRLLGASVPRSVTAETQIHETVVHHDSTTGEDSMEMHQVSSIELPAGQTVELKPGSFHLMLIDLKHGLKAGEKVSVTLRFENAGTRTVKADVHGL